MILISKTFETVSPESAENCKCADSGFIFEDAEYTFRELVNLIRSGGFSTTGGAWLTCAPDIDYSTGEETTESIHYSKKNLPRSEKYWLKALKFAV